MAASSLSASPFLAATGFADIAVERAHPKIIGGSPEEEARQAMMMGPTARLIEEKNPAEDTQQAIAREIERPADLMLRVDHVAPGANHFRFGDCRPS